MKPPADKPLTVTTPVVFHAAAWDTTNANKHATHIMVKGES